MAGLGLNRPGKWDVVAVLSVYLVLLFVLTARYVIGPLGGVGTPALLLGIAFFWWWVLAKAHPESGIARGRNPLHVALFVYAAYMTLSAATAYFRPLTELEVSGSTRALITLVSWLGVALIVADGIDSRDRLDTLLRRLVWCGAFLAAIGLVQFLTGFDPSRFLRLPGLVLNREIMGVGTRNIFNRPFGTTLHPIEFSVVLAVILPLSLHYAFHSRPGRSRRIAWGAAGIIAAGIPLSLSRSGIIGLLVACLVLATAWSWRRRLNALVAGGAFAIVMYGLVPGLLGTIRNLFTGIEDDPSIQARTDRVPRMVDLLSEAPWWGRGFGTYSVEDYFLLDNEYYVSAIEVGLVGLAIIAALFVTAVALTRVTKRPQADPETRHLGQALCASLLVFMLAIGTFDAFHYRMFTGLMFLFLGSAAALWRVERMRQASLSPGAFATSSSFAAVDS